MRGIPSIILVVGILWIGLVLPVQAKKHSSLPAVFATAHSVFVECPGGDITDIHLDRGDRDAILNVQDGVEDWGRYTLSRSRLDADLIVVVRKGRLTRETSGPASSSPISVGHPQTSIPDASNGPGSVNNPNGPTWEKDQLQVYTLQPNGKLNGPIWSRELVGGLDNPPLLLLKILRDDVEKTFPASPAKSPAHP